MENFQNLSRRQQSRRSPPVIPVPAGPLPAESAGIGGRRETKLENFQNLSRRQQSRRSPPVIPVPAGPLPAESAGITFAGGGSTGGLPPAILPESIPADRGNAGGPPPAKLLAINSCLPLSFSYSVLSLPLSLSLSLPCPPPPG